jgi:hypothetical protein
VHDIHLFTRTSPPLLAVLSQVQAAQLPKLPFTYGPTYQNGHVLGLAVSYPGCEQIKGASVAESASTVTVTVLGTPKPANCIGSLVGRTAAVWLPQLLGRRKEIPG